MESKVNLEQELELLYERSTKLTLYDRIGQSYTTTRQPDPRLAATIWMPSGTRNPW